jgi:hypothetical protein
LELWCALFDASIGGGEQRCVARRIEVLDGRVLQAVLGAPHRWTSDGRLAVKVVPHGHPPEPPPEPLAPSGPIVQETDGTAKKAARSYQDLLKNEHDVGTFKHFSSAEVLLLANDEERSSWTSVPVGPKESSLIVQMTPSPDASCLLVKVLTPGEFSYSLPFSRFGSTIQIWPLPTKGINVSNGAAIVFKSIPIQENVPIGFDARPTGPRQPSWHPCQDATLIWAEALDGGDPKAAPKAGFRDCLVTRTKPWGSDGADVLLFGLATRWAGWWFTSSGVGLIKEQRWQDRSEVMWRLDLDGTRVKLWQRNYQEKYADPGSPEEMFNEKGQLVLQTLPPKDPFYPREVPVVLFMGMGASPRGDRPFVDARPLEAGAIVVKRLWRSAAGPLLPGAEMEDPLQEVGEFPVSESMRCACYESPVYILGAKSDKLLLQRETNSEPPNFFVRALKESGEVSFEVKINCTTPCTRHLLTGSSLFLFLGRLCCQTLSTRSLNWQKPLST